MKITRNITLAGVLFAIIIIMQIIKNISPFISGPIINTVMVLAVLELGVWWGIGFSIVVPITSILFAFASPMTMITIQTNGLSLPVIILGNVIFVLLAYYGKKQGDKIFILSLILGAVFKWLFMWGCGKLLILPLFSEKLGKLVDGVNRLFSILQLYSGLLSIVLILPITKIFDKQKNI